VLLSHGGVTRAAKEQGRVAYLSREAVKCLKIWLEHARVAEGPIFRRLIGRDQIGDVLYPGSIAPIFLTG
jgi:hypothetical protein